MTNRDTSDMNTAKDLGEKLFTFVVYTDSHVNQSEHESMSPHEVNKLANGRHRHVLNEINRISPDFAIHLGDLVHPVPVMDIYADAADRFHEQTKELECPLHLIPGNHDVGDKPIKWGPAEVVSDKSLALWEKHFGPHFHSFEHNGCKFILLNAQIINSGLAADRAQRDWLESELDSSAGKRIFVCIHYPPFVFSPEELEYYDNIAEPGRSWLLGLFERHSVEASFSGHVHNFWYHRHADTQLYILPSITFVRHDYSEMYRVPAGTEAGRNDEVKLGYYIVDVHEGGHMCHPIRTYGQILAPDAPKPEPKKSVPPIHPLQNSHTALGIDLRQPWAEIVAIQPSGGLDEFARKIVRNDYPLQALWEMGISRLRVPLQDLTDPQVRSRMADLRDLGMRFTAFSFEIPKDIYRDALVNHGHLLEAWEVGFAWSDFDEIRDGIKTLKGEVDLKIFLTKLRSKEDLETDGQRYYHVINHGFAVSDREAMEDVLNNPANAGLVDGFVFRVARERDAWSEIQAIGSLVEALNTRASIHVRLSTANPAGEAVDDLANANLVAETLLASLPHANLTSYLDTLADADRGYFVHTGLVDRRFNPRLGLKVVRHLHSALTEVKGPFTRLGKVEFVGGRSIALGADGATYVIVLPDAAIRTLAIPDSVTLSSDDNQVAKLIDLATGMIAEIVCSCADDGTVSLDVSSLPANPALIVIN